MKGEELDLFHLNHLEWDVDDGFVVLAGFQHVFVVFLVVPLYHDFSADAFELVVTVPPQYALSSIRVQVLEPPVNAPFGCDDIAFGFVDQSVLTLSQNRELILRFNDEAPLGDLERAVSALGGAGFDQCVAATRGGDAPGDRRFGERVAIWMSAETGEAPVALEACAPLTIPMAGEVESLNVTVAGALMLFAARRG